MAINFITLASDVLVGFPALGILPFFVILMMITNDSIYTWGENDIRVCVLDAKQGRSDVDPGSEYCMSYKGLLIGGYTAYMLAVMSYIGFRLIATKMKVDNIAKSVLATLSVISIGLLFYARIRLFSGINSTCNHIESMFIVCSTAVISRYGNQLSIRDVYEYGSVYNGFFACCVSACCLLILIAGSQKIIEVTNGAKVWMESRKKTA